MELIKFLPIEEAFKETSKRLLETVAEETGGLTSEQRMYYRTRPVEFCKEILGFDPYNEQEEILNILAKNERLTVRSAHGVGKSWTAAICVLWFLSCFVPSTVVTTAPTARQVVSILWKEINSLHAQSKIKLGGRVLVQDWEMSRSLKWFATGFTVEEHSLDRFQGFHNINILVIFDESCGIASKIYEAAEGLLSAGETVRLFLIGNPTNEATEFGKSFKSSLYKKMHLSVFDEPNFSTFGITLEDLKDDTWKKKIGNKKLPRPYLSKPSWAAGRLKAWGEEDPRFQVRVLGNFPEEGEDTFIPLSWIERSYNLDIQPSGEKIMGVDIAGLGRDESIATIRQGNVQTHLKNWHKMNPMESAGIIVNLIKDWKPDVVNIDVIGEGSGVVYRLKELGYEVNGVNVSEKAEKYEEFLNVRAEIYWGLRDLLRNNQLKLLQNETQETELLGTKSEPPTSKGLLKLVPKEKIKSEIGKSPDRADALSLTMYKTPIRVSEPEDLGSIYKESDRTDMVSKEIMPEMDPTNIDNVYKQLDIIYNEKDGREICPKCGYSEGVILLDKNEEVSEANVTYGKCIICKNKWKIIK